MTLHYFGGRNMSRRDAKRVSRVAAFAIAWGLAATASSAPLAASERGGAPAVPSAASLIRFYPTPVASSPISGADDQEVWLAKVQGLMAGAPPMLQQSLLMSQTAKEFVSNLALLEQMQDGSLKRGALDLQHRSKGTAIRTMSLGDQNNLVYKTLTPCRIMDSRNAIAASGVQGPLVGSTLYQIPGVLAAASTYQQYGGANSACGLSTPPGSNIKALAIVITILAPNFDSFLGASDINNLATVLSNVALNYTRGQGLSTLYVVPQDIANTIYFAMPPQLVAHLIFDVVGYYVISDATALECNTTAPTTLTFTGTNGSLNSGACPAGYTKVSVACRTTAFNTANYRTIGVSSGASECEATDLGSGTTLNATATCCRVPGK